MTQLKWFNCRPRSATMARNVSDNSADCKSQLSPTTMKLLTLFAAVIVPINCDVLLWQGLDHKWMNTIFGFETPHRVGSLRSNFTAGPGA